MSNENNTLLYEGLLDKNPISLYKKLPKAYRAQIRRIKGNPELRETSICMLYRELMLHDNYMLENYGD